MDRSLTLPCLSPIPVILPRLLISLCSPSAGTELVGIAATETRNPRKSLPIAVKGTFWRIVSSAQLVAIRVGADSRLLQTVFYLTSLLIIGLTIPYTEPRLLGGSGASEFQPAGQT